MGFILDFQPSVGLSRAFAADCWSIWYSAIFTVPNEHGGTDRIRRPVLELAAAVLPFAVRRLRPPDAARVQAVVANRFRSWLAGFCALARLEDRLDGQPNRPIVISEDGVFFSDDVYSDLISCWGYAQCDGLRPARQKLFGRLCRELVDWVESKPGQKVRIWPGRLSGALVERTPDGRIVLHPGVWNSLDPWATERDVAVIVR